MNIINTRFLARSLVVALLAVIIGACAGGEVEEPAGGPYACGAGQSVPSGSVDVCEERFEYVEAVQGSLLTVDLADYASVDASTEVVPIASTVPEWLAYDAEQGLFRGVYPGSDAGRTQFQVELSRSGQAQELITFDVALTTRANFVSQARAEENQGFIDELFAKEANFLQAGVGYDATTALTYDGHAINLDTLELEGSPRDFSTASKESLHINILVKALLGDERAEALVLADSDGDAATLASNILAAKVSSYETFNQTYPSYGGYLPWFVSQDRGEGVQMYPAGDWTYRAPSLDNGQLAWSIYYAYNALNQIGEQALAARFQAYFDLMMQNAKRLFLNDAGNAFVGEMRFGTVDDADASLAPADQTYFKDSYLLDDAHEGELFILLNLLFNQDLTEAEKQAIWEVKRLNSVVYESASQGPITAIQGWVFSSHEQWKYLILPYTDIPQMRDLFINAQRIRADYANRNKFPGFFAAIHDKDLNYLGNLGIPGLGTNQSLVSDTIAPYATFPMILSDELLGRDTGLRWYQNLLSAEKMVGPYGVSESIDNSDLAIAPLLTWDNKATTSLAVMGGTLGEIRQYLINDELYLEFLDYLETDLEKISDDIYGAELAIARPEFLPGQTSSGPQAPAFNFDFECEYPSFAETTVVNNPAESSVNSSDFVGRYVDPLDEFSSIIVDYENPIDLSVTNQLKIKVLAPVAGILKAKLENGSSMPIEIDAQVTVIDEWVEYNFDFSSQANENHTRLVLFFNAGVLPAGEDIYFFDDLRFSADGAEDNIISNFECDGYPIYLPAIDVIDNPDVSAGNPSATVASYLDPADAFGALSINLDSALDLSLNNQLKIKLWAPVAGILKAKLEGGSSEAVEIDASVTELNQWVEYNFDFSEQAAGDFLRLVLFFNAGVENAGEDVYYFDDLRLAPVGETQTVLASFECSVEFCGIGGVMAIENPASGDDNSSLYVGEYLDPPTPWDALILDFDSAIDLSVNNILKMLVRAPAAGVLKAKLENGTSAPIEIDVQVTELDVWREYSFDFSSQAAENHTRLVLFFNAGVDNSGEDRYLIDNLRFESSDAIDQTLLSDFECSSELCAINGVSAVKNPDSNADNDSAWVGQVIDPIEPFAAITFDVGEPIGLSSRNQLEFKLWAPVAGILKLKLEGGSSADTEIDINLTETQQWSTYTYDLSTLAGSDYTRIVIFLNSGVETLGNDIYYLDDVLLREQ